MSSSVKALFDQAIQPDSPYLKTLQERGLVRRDLTADDLKSGPVRDDAVEQALILFAAEMKQKERQEVLAELQANQPEQDMRIEAFKGFERSPMPEAVLRKMEGIAEGIWAKAIAPIRAHSREVLSAVSAATHSLDAKDYDKAREILDTAESQQAKIETEFQTSYSEARRGLRREYNAEFGSRVWNETATKHFDTLVKRSLFVPPEEMRNAAHALSESKQRLISEKSYVTELEKRAQARPSAKPGASFKP